MIDFHCHLDLYPDPVAVRNECEERGLYVLSVTTAPSAWKRTSELAAGAKRIRTALGIHPQLAHERISELPLFDELLPNTRYVGEIGLDGGPESRPHWQEQQTVFQHILQKCSDMGGRIMSIHSRRAGNAVLESLEAFPHAGVPVLHWFSGSMREFERAARLGCWFSVGPGMILGERGRALVKELPRERVLTESDGPFVQIDGKSVMPWSIQHAIRGIAECWTVSEDAVKKIVHENLSVLAKCLPKSSIPMAGNG